MANPGGKIFKSSNGSGRGDKNCEQNFDGPNRRVGIPVAVKNAFTNSGFDDLKNFRDMGKQRK